jgi:hypothetical protein
VLIECIELIATFKVYRCRQLQSVGCCHGGQTIIGILVVISNVVGYDRYSAIDLLQEEVLSLKQILKPFATLCTLLAIQHFRRTRPRKNGSYHDRDTFG